MNYKGIIFDFDYTLGDSTEGIALSVGYALGQMGHALPPREEIRRTIGFSLNETYHILTGDPAEEKAEEFAALFRKKADIVMVENTSLFPGTMEALQCLKELGMKLGIVTTKYHYRIDAILKKCGASGYFDMIVGGEDVKAPKPEPEGILSVLDAWKLPPKQVLYVGDSVVDARTAEAADVDFAGVTTGTTGKEVLEQYKCVGIFRNLEEIIRIFKTNKTTP